MCSHGPKRWKTLENHQKALFASCPWDTCVRVTQQQEEKLILTQSKSKTIITRSMLTISLIVFTDKASSYNLFNTFLIAFSRLVPTFIHVTEFTIWKYCMLCHRHLWRFVACAFLKFLRNINKTVGILTPSLINTTKNTAITGKCHAISKRLFVKYDKFGTLSINNGHGLDTGQWSEPSPDFGGIFLV